VAKVKKRAGLTGVRNVKAGKATNGKKKTAVRSKGRTPPVRPVKAGRPGKPARPIKLIKPVERVAIRELDPQEKCGEGTSVQFLYRVDHTVDGHRTAHLVFFDPHGWYCEHGRTCPAVAHAKKHNGQFARVS
jgi:hypothetical protein